MVTQKLGKLEDPAATAALYATRPDKSISHDRLDRGEESSRLSSAGAATSLKYASPTDLPSYPSAGVTNIESSAEAAASLANANHQAFEYWKPDTSQAASRAAKVAKDYKATEVWQPPKTSSGSRAAALAAKDARSVEAWHPEATEAGNSAAGQAMRGNGLTSQASSSSAVAGHNKALLAATGAMSGRRRRSGSSPVTQSTYPDSENSAANALSAASFANKSSLRSVQARKDMTSSPLSATMDLAHLKNAAVTNLTREMYTSNPPVAPEVEEKNRQAGQRAAAISMAKQMYEIQQRAITQAQEVDRSDSHVAANYLHNRKQSTNSLEEPFQSPQYVNLQEAAQKLAAERLAKLHDEHAAYRNYYGTNVSQQSRLSVRNRPRRRASSDGDAHVADGANSKPLGSEMSLIKENAVQVDAQKRQKDRDLLMAAAQRNVKASLQSMDEKVFAETGRPSPAMVEDWELKANARAKAASEARMVNHGKVNIGGGKYLDQSEIDEIAAKRVQPTLDEISEKAAIQRARDAELQREEQERIRNAAARIHEEKERNVKTKTEWKRFRDEEKREAKARKEEDRMKRIGEKQLGDDNKSMPTAQAQSEIIPDDEPAAVPESAVSESAPYFDAVSVEEPNEPASKISRTEADSIEGENLNKSPTEEQPNLVIRETNEADAVSEVDPTLLDPALREPVIDELFTPGKNDDELRSSDASHAKIVAARVLSSPSINDVPIEEVTKAIHEATNAQRNLAADLPQPSVLTGSEESQDLAVDPPHAAETPKVPDGTGVSSSLLPESSHPTKGPIFDDKTTHPNSIPDPSHISDVINTAPKSPKGESKVTTWLKSKFGRRTAKSHEPHQESSNQTGVGLEDDEYYKEETRRTSQSVSSISSDEDTSANVAVSRQRKLGSHEDFEKAHDHPDTGKDSEGKATSATSRDAAQIHDNHARDSKFQENL